MRKFMIFCALLGFLSACNPQVDNKAHTKLLGHLGPDKYVVLVRLEGKDFDVHRQAMEKAVKLAKRNGYRYFKVINQGEVSILQNGKVMEQSFVDRNLQEGYFKEGELKSAYRITIRCYRARPFFGQIIDTCRYGRWLQLNH